MVHAIYLKLKSETRRLAGLDVLNVNPDDWQFEWMDYSCKKPWRFTQKSTVNEQTLRDRTFHQAEIVCPYGQVGDVLWVRETWTQNGLGYYRYKADYTDPREAVFIGPSVPDKFRGKWVPSIFMEKPACRTFLQIESIRVERLWAMKVSEVHLEGIAETTKDGGRTYKWGLADRDGLPGVTMPWSKWMPTAINVFMVLWDQINGKKQPWANNPWVWVVGFKVIDKPEGFYETV
jgi:hypothetical protein